MWSRLTLGQELLLTLGLQEPQATGVDQSIQIKMDAREEELFPQQLTPPSSTTLVLQEIVPLPPTTTSVFRD